MVRTMEIKGMIMQHSSRKRAIFHACLVLFVLVLGPAFIQPVRAETDFDDQIKAVEDEISRLHEDKQDLNNSIDVLRSLLNSAKSQRDSIGKKYYDANRKVGELRGNLQTLDQQIARLTSPYDLAMALRKYKDSGRTEEAFIELYKTAYGRSPDHATLSDYDIHALMIEREIRVKVALPVAKGLVLIGKVITDAFKFIRVDMKFIYHDTKRGVDLLFRGPEHLFTKKKATAEFITNMQNKLQRLDKVRGTFKITAKPRKKLAEIVGSQLDGVLGDLVEYQKYLLPDAITVMETYIEDIGGTKKAWERGEEMLKESERMANLSLYGAEDRAKALELAKESKNELIPELQKAEEVLAKLEKPIKKLDQSIAGLEDSIKGLQDEFQDIDYMIQVLESNIDKFTVDRDLARAEKQAAALGRRAYLSSFSLASGWKGWGQYITLAADSVTARSLGLNEGMSYKTPASLYTVEDQSCEYDCRTIRSSRTGSTRTVCKHAIRHNLPRSSTNVDDYSQVTVGSTQGRVTIDNQRRRISGSNPGKTEVYASANVARLRSVNHVCGWENTIDINQVQSPQKLVLQVLKVVDVQYEGSDDIEIKNRTIDLFGSELNGDWWGNSQKNSSWVMPTLVVAGHDKEKTEFLRGDNFDAYLEKGGSGISLSKGRAHAWVGISDKAGKSTMQLGLRDGDGNLAFPKKFTVTSNLVNAETQMPDFIPENMSDRLPIGDEAVLQVTVTGDANMNLYEIRWSATYGGQGVTYLKTTNFIGQDDRWVSKNRVSFTKERITGDLGSVTTQSILKALDTTKLELEANIVRKEDGKSVFDLHSSSLSPLPPRLDNFEIVKVGPGKVPVAKIDVFFPSRFENYGKLGLEGEFMLGIRETLHFMFADLEKIGPAAGVLSISESGEIEISHAGSKDTGSTVLISSLDSRTSRQQKNILLTKDLIQDFLTITINKITVTMVGEGKDAKYRLTIFGDANMTGFKAQWRFLGGIKETTDFTLKEGQWISEHAADEEVFASRRLIEVDVVNAAGMIVGTYRPKDHGAILPPARMKLFMPGKTKPGKAVSVSALIENLHSKDAGDFVCKWEVDPAFGEFEPKESTVEAVTPIERNQGFCRAVFKSADNPEVAGKQAPLRVRLFRVIGGKKGYE